MDRNFYFDVEATMVSGSANFSSIINADFASLGLSEEQALSYNQVNANLQSAARATRDPSTRTSVAVTHKNAMIKSMQRAAKLLSEHVRANQTVTDAQLISLGLLARTKRRRRNAPDTAPRVTVLSVRGRVVNIRVADKDSVNGRSKAFGALHAQVFWYLGEEPPTDSGAYRFVCQISRTSTQIVFPDDVPSGATVWLSARWVSARGETSVASVPVACTVTGGAITINGTNTNSSGTGVALRMAA